MNTEKTNICPKHGIEMEHITTIIPIEGVDEDGNVTYKDQEAEYYICHLCEHEPGPDALDYIEEGSEAEVILNKRITKYKESNPNFNPHSVGGNLIGKLMEFHKDTDADENPRKSMALFQISSALDNCKSANTKGKILPNLGFWWSEPSGTNKTPLLVSGVDEFRDSVYKDHIRYETGTAKGMLRSLSKYYKNDPDKKRDVLLTWDEAQNIIAMMRENALSDIYSFMCQVIDNRLQTYTTIARGEEKYPPITGNIWISGVPEMVEKSVKSFWFQGAGNRFLFVKSKKVWIKDIKRATTDSKDKKHLIDELNLLKKIELVEYSDEFLTAYNEYRREILESIAEIQTDMSASQDIDNYDVLSRIKYPVLVWKLAIVHAASRGNFDDKLLRMDVEDLEEAKKDLEEYHANAMDVFNYWLERSTKDAEIKSSQRIRKKFEKHIESILLHENKRWMVRVIERELENPTGRPGESTKQKVTEAILSPDGKWVKDSDLQTYANMMAKDYNDAIETLKAQEYLVSREAAYNRDGTSGGLLGATFYKWNGSKPSSSKP